VGVCLTLRAPKSQGVAVRVTSLHRLGVGMLVVAAACLGATTSAHAASQSTSLTCPGTALTNVTLNPGDTFTITIVANCLDFTLALGGLGGTGTVTYGNPLGTENSASIGGPGSPWPVPGGTKIIYTAAASGGMRINVSSMSGLTGYLITISSGGGGSSSGTSSTSSAPAPVVQQFGKPLSGTCDAAAPASLNWAGVASGGWGESWAQWANGGAGGAVCTRTLTYSESRAAWVVQ